MIQVALKPSARLAYLLAAAHMSAIIVSFAYPLGLWLLPALAFSMAYSILRYALLKLPGSIVSMRIGEKSAILVHRDGRERSFSFLGSTYVSPHLAVLNMKEEGAFMTQSSIILADAIEPEVFRQLRVWLRWK